MMLYQLKQHLLKCSFFLNHSFFNQILFKNGKRKGQGVSQQPGSSPQWDDWTERDRAVA